EVPRSSGVFRDVYDPAPLATGPDGVTGGCSHAWVFPPFHKQERVDRLMGPRRPLRILLFLCIYEPAPSPMCLLRDQDRSEFPICFLLHHGYKTPLRTGERGSRRYIRRVERPARVTTISHPSVGLPLPNCRSSSKTTMTSPRSCSTDWRNGRRSRTSKLLRSEKPLRRFTMARNVRSENPEWRQP